VQILVRPDELANDPTRAESCSAGPRAAQARRNHAGDNWGCPHRGLAIERQKPLPLMYRGRTLDCGYRLDFLVEGAVVLEVKAIERFAPVHVAQMLSYLRLSKCSVGLLINFHVWWLVRDGIKRVVYRYR
jgi:GxxExxY protein